MKPTLIHFDMQDVFHTFKKGHRIMVHIQSSWFPLVDRNPQRFVDIYTAPSGAFQPATQRVYIGPPYNSFVELHLKTGESGPRGLP
jgi:predicted acyl esterase